MTKVENNSYKLAGINFLSGVTQATLVTVTGYPFDIVKTKLQSQNYRNSYHCVTSMVREKGLSSLYRGATMPWISHLSKRPIQYVTSEQLKPFIEGENYQTAGNYAIGGVTGLMGTVFGTPLQVIKVSMQTSTNSDYKNNREFIRKTYSEAGLRGFYRGFLPTAVKDGIFGMSFVGSYYTFRDRFGNDKWWKNFLNGAAAHCLTWYIFIPIDYVKTNIQRSKTKLRIRDVVRNTIKTQGVRAFWKGVLPACARTIPVSGIAMTGYEYVRKTMIERL